MFLATSIINSSLTHQIMIPSLQSIIELCMIWQLFGTSVWCLIVRFHCFKRNNNNIFILSFQYNKTSSFLRLILKSEKRFHALISRNAMLVWGLKSLILNHFQNVHSTNAYVHLFPRVVCKALNRLFLLAYWKTLKNNW